MQRQDQIAYYLEKLSTYGSHLSTRCKWGDNVNKDNTGTLMKVTIALIWR